MHFKTRYKEPTNNAPPIISEEIRSTTIFTTIPRSTIAPGSTIISSDPALPYGGTLIRYVWKITCPLIVKPKLHSKGRFLHRGQWSEKKPPSAKQRVRLAIVAALEQKPADFEAFLRLMEESGFLVKHGRCGVISFLAPGQEKPTRLRASTLLTGFDPADIQDVIAGKRPIPEIPYEASRLFLVFLIISISLSSNRNFQKAVL